MVAEHELTTRAPVAGGPLTLETIVQQYQTRLARYLMHLVNDQELALDLTQDTFVQAFRTIHALRSNMALTAWLYRIATNLAIKARQRNRRLLWQPLDEARHCAHMAVNAPDDLVVNRELVGTILAQLPRQRAACLLLHVHEGFNYEEVATIVGSTPEAVRKRISRAKEQFRALYDTAVQDADPHAVS